MERTEAEKAPDTVMANWDGCPSLSATGQEYPKYGETAEHSVASRGEQPGAATADIVTNTSLSAISTDELEERCVQFLTCEGTYTTHAMVTSSGKKNKRAAAGTPYPTIGWAEIKQIAANPSAKPKNDSRLIIPSTYREADGRTHEVQRKNGLFHALAVDIDSGNLSLGDVTAAVLHVIGCSEAIIYSSSSATPENKKWRVLILLEVPIGGNEYPPRQEALFFLLAQHGLECDKALVRPGQAVYLPNVPPDKRDSEGQPLFYQWRHLSGQLLHLQSDHPICVTRQRIQEKKRKKAEAEQAVKQVTQATGEAAADAKLIRQFNKDHSLEPLLLKYGFERKNNDSRDYRSPLSTSGTFSTRVTGNRWVAFSSWAERNGVGRVGEKDFYHGDAFDLFVYFENGGDRRAALNLCEERYADGPTRAADLNDTQTLTDVGLARRLAIAGKNTIAFQRDQNRWLSYTGSHWEADSGLGAESIGKQISDELWQELHTVEPVERRTSRPLISFLKASASQRTIKAAVGLARSEKLLMSHSGEFDAHHFLLNVQNGTLDLNQRILRPHQASDKITHLAAVMYDPEAECPLWQQFVLDVMGRDNELVEFLQRSAGLLLSGDVSDQAIWIHHGIGANGKSTFLKIIEQLLASYSAIAAPDMLVHKSFGKRDAENQCAILEGKRFLAAIEQDEGDYLSEATIKQLTGGDTVTARRLYCEPFRMQPTWKIHMAVNAKPLVRGMDDGIWRRIMAVPWTEQFTGERADRGLVRKLLAELPGILNWCLDGYTQWREHGLQPPQRVRLETKQYRHENDRVAVWLSENCLVGPQHSEAAMVLFNDFCRWSELRNEPKLSHKAFSQRLDKEGFGSERPNSGCHRKKTVRHGLRILVNYLDGEDEDANEVNVSTLN